MKIVLVTLALTAVAGAAAAQPLNLAAPDAATPAAPLKVAAETARATPDLADPLDPLAPTKLQTKTLDTAVFAKTAVDAKFAPRATGSLGFLCGLQPGHYDSGGAAAYGVDPHGRFLGAKFSLAF